jgi:hypothetical protein
MFLVIFVIIIEGICNPSSGCSAYSRTSGDSNRRANRKTVSRIVE